MTGKKEYNYTYTDGKISFAREYDITLSGETVTGKTLCSAIYYSYDAAGTLTEKKLVLAGGDTLTYKAVSDTSTKVTWDGGLYFTTSATTDALGRKATSTTAGMTMTYEYESGVRSAVHVEKEINKGAATSHQVSRIHYSDGRKLQYDYDDMERITCVMDSQGEFPLTRYTYDARGQLLTETQDGITVNTMEYDGYGNITKKNGVAYTYDSTWKDLLIRYGSQTISYDKQGNPTNYLGHTLTWEKGRQLKKLVKSDGTTIEYTYNANGIRTSKTVNGVKHTYTLDGSKILKETWNGNTLIPLYDQEDSVCGLLYNGQFYYFIKNLQGDVISITDMYGNPLANYIYDAWGKCTISTCCNCDNSTCDCTIAQINPFRYRAYYYDTETELYYLQSRYYDACVGRFINGDETAYQCIAPTLAGHDAFSYCFNDCINLSDFDGNIAILDDAAFWLIVGIGVCLITLMAYLKSPKFQESWHNFCNTVSSTASSIKDRVVIGVVGGWAWIRAKHTYRINQKAIEKDTEIQRTVTRNSPERYWQAWRKGDYVQIGSSISFDTAVTRVKNGQDVFAVTQTEAMVVAFTASGELTPVGPEIDRGKENTVGYYHHYHPYNRTPKAHVFFLFAV